jgi:hypothetical protein
MVEDPSSKIVVGTPTFGDHIINKNGAALSRFQVLTLLANPVESPKCREEI